MNDKKEKFEMNKAMILGAIVYCGVVLAATTLFITFVLSAFPVDAYVSRAIMTVAGVLIGLSMVAFPIALHTWTVESTHRTVATILYYGEMLIIAINTVVAFMSLLAVYGSYEMPEWAILYEPFSVGSIVYTLFAWGTIFILDPAHKRIQKERQADSAFLDAIADKRLEFVNSKQGEDLVMTVTANDVFERFNPDNFKAGKKDFGSGALVVDPQKGFVKKELDVPFEGSGKYLRGEELSKKEYQDLLDKQKNFQKLGESEERK